MKRALKIFLVILTLALLAVLPLATAAESEPNLNIEAANLSFVDEISILYAVSAENADLADVKLLVWTEPKSSESEYLKGTETCVLDSERYETVSGKSCKVFDCNLLGAHQMTEAVYTRAYVEVGGVGYYSDLSKYSVIRYAHNKLGYTGTATENETLKATLEAVLSYGVAVQIYTDYNTDRLPTDRFYKVTVEGGTLADGTTNGLYKEGDEITVKGDDLTKTYTVTMLGENCQINASTGTISEKASIGLSFTSNGDGTCYVSGIGSCADTDIIIPKKSPDGETVTAIGNWAFEYCDAITSVFIPEGVCRIERSAFRKCESLTSVSLPDSLVYVGKDAFYGCESLAYSTYSDRFGSSLNYLGNSKNPYLLLLKAADDYVDICIPHPDTKLIGPEAFKDAWSLSSIELPAGLISIGESAFSYTESLHNITIPASVEYIEGGAFSSPYLWSVTFDANSSLKKIGRGAFSECSDLSSITLPDNLQVVEDSAFAYCSSLVKVSIPDSLESFGSDVFSGCDSLAYNEYDNAYYLGNESNPQLILVKAKDTYISSCDIREGTKFIGAYAFSQCQNLASISIPATVTAIYPYAFEQCKALASVDISSNSALTLISNCAFSSCESIRSIKIPSKVESIEYSAFMECRKLVEIINESSINIIAGEGYNNGGIGCYVLEVHTGDSKLVSEDGYLFYSCDGQSYLVGYVGESAVITLPESYNGADYTIKEYAFYNDTTVSEITINAGVREIPEWAFYDCIGLTKLKITGYVESIGSFAFCGCENLVSIDLGENKDLKTLAANAFRDCSAVESLSLPFLSTETNGYNTSCLSYMFMSVPSSLRTVTITGGDTIADYAFYGCSYITNITLPDGIKSIGSCAFSECKSLVSVNVADTVESLGTSAFSGCSSLTDINIPSNITSIPSGAFYGCSSLTKVTLPESITRIGGNAFGGCLGLTSITIPKNIQGIDYAAFFGCFNLVEVINRSSLVFEAGSSNYGGVAVYAIEVHSGDSKIVNMDGFLFYTYNGTNYLFAYIGDDTTPVLPDSYNGGAYVIFRSAFHNAKGITSIVIPTCVTEIGNSAFYYSDLLTDVYYRGTAEEWEKIKIGSSNEKLTSATIHYNYTTAN